MPSSIIKARVIDECLHDPVLGAQVLLGYEVPPHLELRLWAMWTKKQVFDSSGFGTGKTLSIAIIAALRSILMENRHGGIVSYTFEQGHKVSGYFDVWRATSAVFRSQVKSVQHGGSLWNINFKNGSTVRTIPPDWKNDGMRAGSEDWNDGYFDEVTKYPKIDLFNRQFMTRVRKPIDPRYDRHNPIFDHHWYLGGTARSQYHPLYEQYVKRYLSKMQNGSEKHDCQAWNFTHIPEYYQEKFGEMDGINNLLETMSPEFIQQEIYGKWTMDGDGFYSASDVKRARNANAPVLLEREI